MSGDLIRHRNRSKLVEKSLIAIIDLLQGAKYKYFVVYMACGGTFSIFCYIFSCYYCSIDLKMQSKHSGLHTGTRSLVHVMIRFI